MSFVLINHSSDGTHNRVYKTVDGARKALAAFCLGRKPSGKEYSDHARGYLKETAIEAVKAINAKRYYPPP